MFHKILSKVATSHLRDFGSVRIAFSQFNQIGREEYFYRSEDLFNLNDWIDEANALRTFRLRCYQAGNLEAIYMRDGMLNLAFSVDPRGFVHNYPSFSREFVDQMNYMITTSMDLEHGGHAIVVSGNVQLETSAMIFT
ncbi:hypothetical protein F2Q69_00021580 [Brassica cretica]|uniref:Uncharacterized protein n=1 Tax=Brassica cretica TaxID=69181 RepID=A0A8S9Q7H5_BRACR|nr:hypothetical protein F2Q69_00021580 [Brassica cretica]